MSNRRLSTWSLSLALLAATTVPAWSQDSVSPCHKSLENLAEAVAKDPATRAAFQATFEGLRPLPPGYTWAIKSGS